MTLSGHSHLAGGVENDNAKRAAALGGWLLLFLACITAYFPGLAGPFVFDDFDSLNQLGSRGGVVDWETFKAFVLGGHTGPTGRPLSLLSFLLDGNNWPADPRPFKRTNVLIHLANGALLGVLISQILRLLEVDRDSVRWIALLSAACWLLHPFLVSTTLYVVQRMAQLSTLFVLLGLVTHLHFRTCLNSNATRAYMGMSLSMGVFTFFAMISKENGILLPLLIVVIEVTAVASQRPRVAALHRYWAIVFLAVPSLVIGLYLGEKVLGGQFFETIPARGFSIYERLLTQPRVLADYLWHWFAPDLYTAGVFQDHFVKSSGLLSPLTTLLGVVFNVALLSVALLKRRRWPLFSLAILFFYASHVLESSVINLELYFEHRNYLATVFLFLPLVVVLQRTVSRELFAVVAVAAVLLLGGFTRYSATVWKDYPSMVEASAQKAPTSARAQSQYAINLYNARRYDESLRVIDAAIESIPGNNSLLISRSIMLCKAGVLTADDFERTADILSDSLYDPRDLNLYTALSSSVADEECPDVSVDAIRTLFTDMLQVEKNGNAGSLRYAQIKYFIGFAHVRAGAPAKAVAAFEQSLQSRPGAAHSMLMAAVLATGNYLEEALRLSDLALQQLKTESTGGLRGQRVGEDDIRAFQANIRAELMVIKQEHRDESSPE